MLPAHPSDCLSLLPGSAFRAGIAGPQQHMLGANKRDCVVVTLRILCMAAGSFPPAFWRCCLAASFGTWGARGQPCQPGKPLTSQNARACRLRLLKEQVTLAASADCLGMQGQCIGDSERHSKPFSLLQIVCSAICNAQQLLVSLCS